MFSDFQIYGHQAHLVLSDSRGCFEVSHPFLLLNGTVTVDHKRVLDAINERNKVPAPPPIHRPVKLDVLSHDEMRRQALERGEKA